MKPHHAIAVFVIGLVGLVALVAVSNGPQASQLALASSAAQLEAARNADTAAASAVKAAEASLTAARAAKQATGEALAALEATPPKEEPPKETAATWEGFTAANPMPASRPPGSVSSAFNQPVGASPTVLSNSAEIVAYLLRQGSPYPANASSSSAWKHPTVFAASTDPLVELRATEPWGTNVLTGRKVHYPTGAQAAPPLPSAGGDAHLEIVQPNGEAEDLWRANQPSGGVLSFGWGGPANIAGTGVGGAATAANLDLWAGQLRGVDLKAGAVNHALCAVVKANKSGGFVYPATHTDGKSAEAAAPLEGQRFYLAYTDSEIEALPVKPWKKTVLKGLAHYGFYDCDSGGAGFSFELEAPVMFTAFNQPNPLAEVGKTEGLGTWEGSYIFNFSEGVNWGRLRAIAPPAH